MSKVNHGPCLVCGRPILYLGCLFCGPACNFSLLADRAKEALSRAPAVPEPSVGPEPSTEPPFQPAGGFMSIQPAPDEPPGRNR